MASAAGRNSFSVGGLGEGGRIARWYAMCLWSWFSKWAVAELNCLNVKEERKSIEKLISLLANKF